MKRMTPIVALAVAAVGLAFQGRALAEFPEKDITFIIPYSPGGGMDSTARQIASVMPKYLPRQVTVIPKNVPGAAGRKGYGQLYRAEPDGYTICVFNMPGAAIPQLIGRNVTYDITRIVWLGRMSISPYLLAVSSKSAIKSLDDIKHLSHPLTIAHTGFGSTSYTAASIAKHVVGYPARHITGYKGSKDYILGMLRGDAQAAMAPTQSFSKFIQSGDIRGIVTFEETSSFPGVPTIAEAGYPQLTGLGVERLVGAPPGLPDEVRRILSDAIGKAAHDAESAAWGNKTNRPFSHLSGYDTETAVAKALETFKQYPEALQKQD